MESAAHIPPLRPAPNPTARLIQDLAKRGILLCLDEDGALCASGRFLDDGKIVEDDHSIDEIRENYVGIKQEFKRIAATGEDDPLGLVDLSEESEYHFECARVERLMARGWGEIEAIRKHALETKAETAWVMFPRPTDSDSLARNAGNAGASHAKAPQPATEKGPGNQPRRYKLLSATELSAMAPSKYRVKSVLPREGLAAIFGPPGVSKSFLALDLAFAISDGNEWSGYRVERCDVLYLCLEGQAGLTQRVQAYREHYGQDTGKRIRFITAPFSLLYHDDVGALVNTVKDAGIRGGVIMIDTLSAASAGADENSSVDMGRILEALKHIREECGGLVTLIHHSGKDVGRGLRGHSSLLAALDAVIEVKRDHDRRSWQLAKSKDGLDGEEHQFRLSVVELDTDEDGDPITSCVIGPEERAADSVRRVKAPKGNNQKVVYEVLGELLRASRDFGKGGARSGRPCVRLDDLIEACYGRIAVDNGRVPERVRIAVNGMVSGGCLILRDGWLWIP